MKTLLKLAFIISCLAMLASCGEDKDSPTPGDTTSPTVSFVSPSDGTTDVSIMTSITVRFSESIDAASVSTSSLQLSVGSSTISGAFEVTSSSVVFTPSSELTYGTEHTITVGSGIKDDAGNNLSGSVTSTFTTEDEPDTDAPAVVSSSPTNGATDVEVDANIVITFSEQVDINSVDDNSLKLTEFGVPDLIDATVSVDGAVMTVNPDVDLDGSTTYNISFAQGGIKDLAGNGLASSFEVDFTTEVLDTELPSVLGFSVTNGETGVDADGGITINFSEPMDPASFQDNILFRKGGTTNYLPISFEVNGNDVTVTLDEGMKGNTEYVIDVTVNVTDLAGNKLDFKKGRVFTTAEVPLTILSITPSDDAEHVEVDDVITITFSEPVDESTLSVLWAGSGPSFTTSVEGAVVTVTPDTEFTEFETSYTFQVFAADDIYGNSMASTQTIRFTTIFASEKYYYYLRNYEQFQSTQASSLAFRSATPQITYESKDGLTDRSLWRFKRVGSEFGIINKYLEDNNFSAEYLYTFPISIDNELAYIESATTGSLWELSTPTNGVRLMKSRGNILDGQNITMTSDQSTSSGYRWWYFVKASKVTN